MSANAFEMPEPPDKLFRKSGENLQRLARADFPPLIGDFYELEPGIYLPIMRVQEKHLRGMINGVRADDFAWVIEMPNEPARWVRGPRYPPKGDDREWV